MEMASRGFLGWLVGFFGKEYMRNLKVMNIEGKKNYLPMCARICSPDKL